MKRAAISLLTGLAILAAAAAFYTGGSHMETRMVTRDIPPMDRQVPAGFETATFSLG